MIVSYASVWSITYDHNLLPAYDLAYKLAYDLAYHPSIVLFSTGHCHYDRKTFIVQATDQPRGQDEFDTTVFEGYSVNNFEKRIKL
jgi:hypothetical protein